MHDFKVMKEAIHSLVDELNSAHIFNLDKSCVVECFALFPSIMELVQIVFVIPVQTAVVERGFSFAHGTRPSRIGTA